MKDFGVIFTETGARVVKGDLSKYPHALINPSLDKVRTVPPHLWKRVGNEIVGPNELKRKLARINLKVYLTHVSLFALGFLCAFLLNKM